MDSPCDLCSERAYIHVPGGKYCKAHYDELTVWHRALNEEATTALGGPFPQRCPQRGPDKAMYGDSPLLDDGGVALPDRWAIGYGLAYPSVQLLTCSYCGSVNPDTFMEKISEGWIVGPTDKDYKAYLRPADQISDVGKFYFEHLSVEQRQTFVGLVNERKVAIGYPGHFYRMPFFMVRSAF